MQLMPPGLGGEGCGRGVDRTAEWTAAHSVSCRIHINVQWHQAPCRTDTALSVSCVASGHIGVSSTLLNTDMHDADWDTKDFLSEWFGKAVIVAYFTAV
jgi:hypothetical protein